MMQLTSQDQFTRSLLAAGRYKMTNDSHVHKLFFMNGWRESVYSSCHGCEVVSQWKI